MTSLIDRRVKPDDAHWVAYIVQDNGCDYTLACGHIAYVLKAVEAEDAWEEIYNILYNDGYEEDHYGLDESRDIRLSHVVLLEVSRVVDVLEEMRDTHKDRQVIENIKQAKLQQEEEQQRELREYARLHAKYGKNDNKI